MSGFRESRGVTELHRDDAPSASLRTGTAGKRCSLCGETKQKTEFSIDRGNGDGLRSWCNSCTSIRQKASRRKPGYQEKVNARRRQNRNEKHRARDRRSAERYRIRHPEKCFSRAILAKAIKRGEVQRSTTCQMCGGLGRNDRGNYGIHGHHYAGYAYPLLVMWLCRTCHDKLHRELKPTNGRIG